MLNCMPCRYEHFEQDWYGRWMDEIRAPRTIEPEVKHSYRKLWEFAAILQSLHERGMLTAGRRGIGFAVGGEPLSSVFAKYGCDVLATDLVTEDNASRWDSTNQMASSLESLFHDYVVNRETFDQRVSFAPADMNNFAYMNNFDDILAEKYDFVWSSCAIEHLGSIQKGIEFVKNSMRLLKPGGISIHTTEFSVVSNDDTVSEGWNNIFRRRDIEEIDYVLRRHGCGLERLDFFPGTHRYDLQFDSEPYFQRDGVVHLKLDLLGYVCTSYLLIARRP